MDYGREYILEIKRLFSLIEKAISIEYIINNIYLFNDKDKIGDCFESKRKKEIKNTFKKSKGTINKEKIRFRTGNIPNNYKTLITLLIILCFIINILSANIW